MNARACPSGSLSHTSSDIDRGHNPVGTRSRDYLAEHLGIMDCSGSENHTMRSGFDGLKCGALISDASSYLERNSSSAEREPEVGIRLAAACTVEIDDVDQVRTIIDPLLRFLDRIVRIRRNDVVPAMEQPYDGSVEHVDGWNDLHGAPGSIRVTLCYCASMLTRYTTKESNHAYIA